jgi:nucleoside-diphosphate-sugar epimerase
MKRLLVTGATSFVGQHLLPALAREYELDCLVRDPARLDFLPEATIIAADLADPAFVQCLPARADGILHMAVAAPSLTPAPMVALQVNTASTLALLEWGQRAGVERLVLTSSGSVYGPQPTPITEDVAPRPADLLGVTKYAAEMLAGLYTARFAVVVLRIWRPYGPGQPANFLIPRLVGRIRAGEPISLNREGRPRANTIYISDLVEVVRRALRQERSVTLNVAHRQAHSIHELCRELEALVGQPARYEHLDREAGDLIADVTRLRQTLGFEASISLAEGLRRTWGGDA